MIGRVLCVLVGHRFGNWRWALGIDHHRYRRCQRCDLCDWNVR